MKIKYKIKLTIQHIVPHMIEKVIHNQKGFAQNQTYPVEQQSPPIVHIKMIAKVCDKRNSDVKYIVFQKKQNIVKGIINLHL